MRVPSKSMRACVGFLLGAGTLASCAPAQVPFQVVFPSEETFVVTNTVNVFAFRVPEGGGLACANLVALSASGIGLPDDALVRRENLQPCALRSGIALPDPGGGPRLFVVEGLVLSGNVILVGCTQGEVYGGATVSVNLSTTTRYAAAFAANPTRETADDHCGGGV